MISPSESLACGATNGECHVCGDVAVIGRVLDINATDRTGTIVFAEVHATVALDLVDVRVGDDVLVHLGFAIERVSP